MGLLVKIMQEKKSLGFQFQKAFAISAVFSIEMGPVNCKEKNAPKSAYPIAVRIGIQFLQRACKYAKRASIQYTADGFQFQDEIIFIPLIAFGLLHQQEITFRPPRIHVLRATKWFASPEREIK